MPRRRRLLLLVPLVLLVPVLLSVFGRAAPAADPELVTLAATADRAALRAGERAQVVVRLQLAAASREQDTEVGVNLGLLLDTSGSMAGEPIEQARAAVRALVGELRPHDRLTLVTFDSRAQIVLPPTVIDDADLDAVAERIDEIQAEGTTDLAAGLGTLLQQLATNPTVGDLDRIVVVSDGVPNDATPIAGQVAAARDAGIAITTLGVGLEYDEVLLGEMARSSGGRFHHVEHGATLGETVVAEVFGAQRQVAGNVRLQLSSGPGVTIARVLGSTQTMTNVHAYGMVLAELAEGEAQEVFVELEVAAAKPGATLELLDAVVSFDDRVAGSGRLERRAFVAMPVSDDAAVLAMRMPDVETGAVAARAAAATIEAIVMTRAGDLDGAEKLLLENENALDELVDQANSDDPAKQQLYRQKDAIAGLRSEVEYSRGGTGTNAPELRAPERWGRVAKEANASSMDMLQAK